MAIQFLRNPITILTIGYLIVTAVYFDYSKLSSPTNGDKELIEARSHHIELLVSMVFISCLLLADLVLHINRVDYQVLEIDNKIQRLIEKFSSYSEEGYLP